MNMNYLLLTQDITMMMIKAFQAVKTSMIGRINLTAIASAFAAVFVIIKLIGIINKIESDDQGAGFGHVPLFDILRPLLFYFLTVASPTIMIAVDGITTGLSENIQKAIPAKILDMETLSVQLADNDIINTGAEVANVMHSDEKWYKKILTAGTSFVDNLTELIGSFFFTGLQLIVKLIYTVVYIIYQFMLCIMVGIAQMKLIVFGVLAPFAFAVSILEPWKGSYQKLIGFYVECSLWAPIGLIIMYAITTGGNVIIEAMNNFDFGFMGSSAAFKNFAKVSASMIGKLLLMALAIRCIAQIPDIANKALSLGSPADSSHHGAEDVAGQGKSLGNQVKNALFKNS